MTQEKHLLPLTIELSIEIPVDLYEALNDYRNAHPDLTLNEILVRAISLWLKQQQSDKPRS